MAKYNLDKLGLGAGLLNDQSKSLISEDTLAITYINYDDLQVDGDNKYTIDEDDLEELADSIKDVGLQQNLTVVETENGKYSILAGQRRYLAIGKLIAQGNTLYKRIPCHVVDLKTIPTEGLSDDLKKLYVIATTNRYRNMTVSDQLLMAEQLDQVYSAMKKKGVVGQRRREFIAETMGVSPRKAQDLLTVNKTMTDEIKDKLENEDLSLQKAVDLVREDVNEEKNEKKDAPALPIAIDRDTVWKELNLDDLANLLDEPVEISDLEMEAILRAGKSINRIIKRLQKKVSKRGSSINE